MIRGLRRFVLPTILPSRSLTSTAGPRRSKYLFQTPIANGSSISSLSAHYLLDEMSQTTVFAFRALNFLKGTFVEPDLVSSVHCLSLKANALSDLAARTSLLTAYARAQDLGSAMAIFDETAARDVIFWNAIISAYVLNCHYKSSFLLFQEMVESFGEFDSTTLLIMLMASSRMHYMNYGTTLHGTIIKRNFLMDGNLCNALIDMYAKCDNMSSSELVFEEMEVKDISSWNSMISGCTFNGFPERSVYYFREMRRSNVDADAVTLSSAVTACSLAEEYWGHGESVHALVIKMGYEANTYSSLSNCLILFYFRCENVEAADAVFKGLANKNVVSWNAMIGGLLDNGRYDEFLNHFWEMQSKHMIQPDDTTLITIIPACRELNLLREGKSIHAFAIKKETDPLDSSVENALLDMYLECGDLKSSFLLFRKMTNKDIISWNTMIFGFSQNDSSKEEARASFCELLQSGPRCSVVTFLAILPSCTGAEDLRFGKALHACLIRYGLIISMSAMNALMLMYINCGDLSASILLFERLLPISDIVSWNTMIVGCVQNGYYKEAFGMLTSMCSFLLPMPDSITFVSAVSACGNLGLLSYGQCLHGLALKSLVNFDIRVKNALLTMYFHCNDSKSAETLFKLNGDRNLCSWNCMISGFAQNKEADKSLQLFQNMEGLRPNEFSIVGVICACTQLVDLSHGKEVTGYVFRVCLQRNTFILSTLVDMYSKCGRLDIATRIFTSSNEKSIASWNSMISAYGFHGQGRRSIELFSLMCGLGVKATESTFIALLSACSHCGLVDEGWKYYDAMSEKFGIEPTAEHHVCMIDMLGRAGRLGEAFEFLKRLPIEAKPGVWGALLSACHDHGDLDIGKTVAGKLFCLEPENTGYYVTLSNLFAYYEMWSEALRTRGMILDKGLLKPLGCSAIDVLSRERHVVDPLAEVDDKLLVAGLEGEAWGKHAISCVRFIEMAETDKNIEIWKVKKLIRALEEARGNGTSMISLIMPPRDQVSRVTKMLGDEYGTASNIKSRVNRQSVLGAITSAQQRLKLYNKVPPNGLVLYTGTIVTEDGKEKKVTIDFEPFKPINASLYLCDNKFHTEALNELLESDDKFGFIVMDGNGTLFGTLSGNTREVLHKFTVDLPKKHGRGGQSALRFARLRMEKRHNYVRKTAELATQFFINPATSQPNVAGLILAGSADFKTELSQSDMFDQRLQAKILNVVDVSYGGENGFNQAIELSAEILSNVKFIQEKKLIGKYFEEISQDTGKYVFGVEDTLKALEMGAVETLIVWENLDINRYVLKHSTSGETIIKHLRKDQETDQNNFLDSATSAELEVQEKISLLEWFANEYKRFGCTLEFVTNKSQEGSQFCRGFGGIGGILRYQLDLRAFDELSDEEFDEDSE
ncbi:unnamed protein product [Musa acuminata var. zebrina]